MIKIKEFSFKYICEIPDDIDTSEFWTMIKYRDIKRNKYMVSNKGRVKNIQTGRIISQCISEKGYPMVALMSESGKQKTYKLHRIVGFAYVPGCTKEKCELDHVNCNKLDCSALNLEWVTHEENIRRAYSNGLIPKIYGERHGNHSLKDSEIERICVLLCQTNGDCRKVKRLIDSPKKHYNLHAIQRIKYKQSGMHISDKYFKKNDFKKPNDYRN